MVDLKKRGGGGAFNTMLTSRQHELFEQFRDSTHANEHLDAGEGILVGLTAAMALDCQQCIRYYLSQAKKAGISEGKVSEVVAKVMAVSANQKRLQTEEVLGSYFEKTLIGEIA